MMKLLRYSITCHCLILFSSAWKMYQLLNYLVSCKLYFQLHASIAEVAAAKARMFVNKPDGSMSVCNPLSSLILKTLHAHIFAFIEFMEALLLSLRFHRNNFGFNIHRIFYFSWVVSSGFQQCIHLKILHGIFLSLTRRNQHRIHTL